MEELMKEDLYEFLNINVTANENEIKKAYRKKALTCHPDKNPDNPKAAELFQKLSKALEILTDAAARAAYDKVTNARKAAKVRHRELDSKRKKLKEDLEAREKFARELKEKESAEKLRKQAEIERLRKEGLKLAEEELLKRTRREIIKKQSGLNKNEANSMPRLKVNWKSSEQDETNGGYNQEILDNIFRKYDQVTCLVSSEEKGSARIEFSTTAGALKAFESERGNPENPLTLSWISGQPDFPKNSPLNNVRSHLPVPEPSNDSVLTLENNESLVLMKMRQAEKRKKSKQQIIKADELKLSCIRCYRKHIYRKYIFL